MPVTAAADVAGWGNAVGCGASMTGCAGNELGAGCTGVMGCTGWNGGVGVG